MFGRRADAGNTADPFCVVSLGATTIEDTANKQRSTTNPYFGACYELETSLPGAARLKLAVYDWDQVRLASRHQILFRCSGPMAEAELKRESPHAAGRPERADRCAAGHWHTTGRGRRPAQAAAPPP
eukprot:SAG11_NODE_16690_length_540_cov_1.192744_1_plen_126_part_10